MTESNEQLVHGEAPGEKRTLAAHPRLENSLTG